MNIKNEDLKRMKVLRMLAGNEYPSCKLIYGDIDITDMTGRIGDEYIGGILESLSESLVEELRDDYSLLEIYDIEKEFLEDCKIIGSELVYGIVKAKKGTYKYSLLEKYRNFDFFYFNEYGVKDDFIHISSLNEEILELLENNNYAMTESERKTLEKEDKIFKIKQSIKESLKELPREECEKIISELTMEV